MQIVPLPRPPQIRKPSVCSAKVVDFVANPPTKFTKRGGTGVDEWAFFYFQKNIANLFFLIFGCRKVTAGWTLKADTLS